ncbi:MAG TPA: TonB family protein [Candidatus Angelobacter sp.]
MQSEPNPIKRSPGPGSDTRLTFLIQPEPWLRIFFRNIGDLFRPAPPKLWLSSPPGEYWADALVHRPPSWSGFAGSLSTHILVVTGVYFLTLWWLNQPHVIPDDVTQSRPLDHYELSEYLPPVSKAEKKPEPPKRRVAQKADPEYAPQEIVSVHVDHNSTRQTIVNPLNPKLLKQDTPLPNIVAWTAVPSPAPVAPNHPMRQLPLNTPPVVPPIEQPAQRNLNALQFPVPPQVVPPAETPVQRNMAAVNLPTQPDAAVPPSPTAAQRPLGEINLALNTPSVEEPKLPVPEQQAATGQQTGQASQAQAAAVPPSEPVTSGTGKSQAQQMGQLLVLNVNPVAPNGPMVVPEGNRQGEFAAGPNGRVGATARPEIAAGGNSSGGSRDGVNSLPGNVYIAVPPKKVTGNVVVSAPNLPSAPSARRTISDTPVRDTPPAGKIETEVFGDRKSYSMALNMPNLTSAIGTSWIIRFAEMNPAPGSADVGVSAPIALSKVDPAYPTALMHDRIEGVVILYAVIHSDGSVGEVKVLQGVDETLDENARNALQKWHFRPGTKNGAPVDLEAVIRIPFRAPRSAF